jgi:hypothetical protein
MLPKRHIGKSSLFEFIKKRMKGRYNIAPGEILFSLFYVTNEAEIDNIIVSLSQQSWDIVWGRGLFPCHASYPSVFLGIIYSIHTTMMRRP